MITGGAFGYPLDYAVCWFVYLSLLVHTYVFFRLVTWRRHRRVRLVVGNALVLLCLGGTLALGAETYLRFLCIGTDGFGVSLPARKWFAMHTRVNSLGCRDREWSKERRPGIRRIAFVGDSFTYGWGIERVEDRFTDLVQSRFDERSPGTVEVLNVSKPGWGTEIQTAAIIEMLNNYAVDEVVLCYVANDIEWLLPVRDDFNPKRPPEPHWFNPDSSCLLDYLYRRLWLPRTPTVRGYFDWIGDGYADDGIRSSQEQQLGVIVESCRTRGALLRVILIPFLSDIGGRFHPSGIHDQVARFFANREVPVVDLLPVVQGLRAEQLILSSIDAHPNAATHRLFSEAIWSAFYERPTEP